MKLDRIVNLSVALCVLAACAAAPAAWADRDRWGGGDRWADHDRRDSGDRWGGNQQGEFRRGERRDVQRVESGRERERERERAPRGYVFDRRYRHDRYYPPRGHVVRTLPRDHRVVHFHGVPYYFHSGIWYRRSGVQFTVIAPPIGIVVPFLPPFYTTIWVGGVPYYYADNVYYVWQPEQNGYMVAEAPPEAEVVEQPAVPEQLFIYPKKGQSKQQQETDRYECHRWGADQSGFDPTQPGGNVPDSQRASKRSDYQRAMKACLEARGYSVK